MIGAQRCRRNLLQPALTVDRTIARTDIAIRRCFAFIEMWPERCAVPPASQLRDSRTASSRGSCSCENAGANAQGAISRLPGAARSDGAVPLVGPTTRRVVAGILVEPRFRWPAVSGSALVPGSARDVPPWIPRVSRHSARCGAVAAQPAELRGAPGNALQSSRPSAVAVVDLYATAARRLDPILLPSPAGPFPPASGR
jgi:hypothetical protein